MSHFILSSRSKGHFRKAKYYAKKIKAMADNGNPNAIHYAALLEAEKLSLLANTRKL